VSARPSITAAGLMQRLERDPAWVRKDADREEQRRVFESSLITEQAPLLADLAAEGVRVSSVWDLVNTAADYTSVLPVLMSHLRKPYHPNNREGMARALAVKSARSFINEIIDLYRAETNPELQTALACAIAEASNNTTRPELMKLAEDRRFGGSRTILLTALAKNPTEDVRELLERLAVDEAVKAEVKFLLRRLRERGRPKKVRQRKKA
jgi:hypothetical protein